MFTIIKVSKYSIALIAAILAFVFLCLGVLTGSYHLPVEAVYTEDEKQDLQTIIEQIFKKRNTAILENNMEALKSFYDTSTRLGTWAYEHQCVKAKYFHSWARKQGVRFTDINSHIIVRNMKEDGSTFSANFMASTEYTYNYEDGRENVNSFRIGTYHVLSVRKQEDSWLITKEWYTDPFADSISLNGTDLDEITSFILSMGSRDFSNLNIRRKNAVEYADRYCGAASDGKNGYSYNKKYRNYNSLGGDCANFASQILYEGGKFRKTSIWNYDKSGGSRAWVNAATFKNYMIYSGRASVIAYGTYKKVFKLSYSLLPGDFIAYEKKGKITHISVVTGADTKGYSLVNCHNTDRYRVPWDLGWSGEDIKFWLVRVHF